MYQISNIRWLNFPAIPQHLLDNLPRDFSIYEKKSQYSDIFFRSDSFIQEINDWCKQHICESIDWGFQVIMGDAPVHKDLRVDVKFHYVIDQGGENVYTRFWNDDRTNVVESIKIPQNRWHLLRVNTPHSVEGVEKGQTRFSISGKIF